MKSLVMSTLLMVATSIVAYADEVIDIPEPGASDTYGTVYPDGSDPHRIQFTAQLARPSQITRDLGKPDVATLDLGLAAYDAELGKGSEPPSQYSAISIEAKGEIPVTPHFEDPKHLIYGNAPASVDVVQMVYDEEGSVVATRSLRVEGQDSIFVYGRGGTYGEYWQLRLALPEFPGVRPRTYYVISFP